ncbi:hypothetical protein [Pseudonocardia pini]|uniref:hypothetical protein n=1 Tax=Pseudonocardia pini TaxID=2758030 RepID=UPI0015F04519|nr:hypothetical protein [Pseudonocardia pini]
MSPSRPVVDGTKMTSGALRAEVQREVERLRDDHTQRIEQDRDELGETAHELLARFDFAARIRKAWSPAVVGAAVATVAVAVMTVMIRRRRTD